jgi:outer membrane cobalamin receptor
MMTSGSRFTLVNAGSRYARDHVLITNHLAWSRETVNVGNRDNVALSDETYREWTWRGDASLFASKRNTVEFGAQLQRVRETGGSNEFIYAPALTTAADSFSGTATQGGAYAQEALTLGRVRLTAGARQDAHSLSSTSVTTPYASLSLDLSMSTHLQFDWGAYAQFPEVSQFRSSFAVGTLSPEKATHYELAVEQKLDARTRIRVEVFDRQDRDLLGRPDLDPRILTDGTVVQAVPTAPLLNSGRGYARGFEAFLQRRTANGFTGWVSYAYERTRVTDSRLGLTFPSDSDQSHTVNAYLSRRVRPTVNISGRFSYGSGMPLPGFYTMANGSYQLTTNRNGLRASAYQRTDVRLNKAYVHHKLSTTLYAEVVNVTNHSNRNFDSPGPYDPTTLRNTPNFYSMFPILPSVGFVLAF